MRFLLFIFTVFLINNAISSQYKDSTLIHEIDSILTSPEYDTSAGAQEKFYEALKKSRKVKYKKGMLKSYLSLMWYYGYQSDLDSTLHYAHKFETSDYSDQERELLYKFYYGKAGLMYDVFGFEELALEIYNMAYSYLDHNDVKANAQIKTDIAYLYILRKQFQKAIDLVSPYAGDSVESGDFNKTKLFTILAMAYQHKKQPEKSLEFNTRALEIANTSGQKEIILYLKNIMTYDYFALGDRKKAIDSALVIREKLVYDGNDGKINNRIVSSLTNNSQLLSDFYAESGDYKKAIYYLNDLLERDPEYPQQAYIYRKLAMFYDSISDNKNVIAALRKQISIVDTARQREKELFINYYDARLKFMDEMRAKEMVENENQFLLMQNKKQKQYMLVLAIGVLCVFLVFITVYANAKYFKTKEKVKKLEKNERELLKSHIEVRENELALLIDNKFKMLSQLEDINKELRSVISTDNTSSLNEVSEQLDTFLKNTKEDKVFLERLESQYPGMVLALKQKHSDLSPTEIRHCILVRLGLSVKESAQLLNVGVGAIKMGRNRAKAKMNIPPEQTLNQYIDEVCNSIT